MKLDSKTLEQLRITKGKNNLSIIALAKNIGTSRYVRKYWLNISTLFYLNTFSYLIFVY